ncbi:hypothetical protein D4R42_03030 [bacterium]|nr:MAG: hypothetical protein D4R42_03030 [bacterium]
MIEMYATWLVGTSEVTTVTKFGVAGHWAKLPDVFPPIEFINTTSVAIGVMPYRGCIVTIVQTTTGDNGPGPAIMTSDRRGVEQYVKGDRWFRLRSGPATLNALAVDTDNIDVQRVYTQIELYYRDKVDGGEITA